MSYTNADKLAAVLSYWLKPMGDSVAKILLGDKLEGINTWARRIFALSPDYSITNDVAFLFKPTLDVLLSPAIKNLLASSGVSDDEIPAWAHNLIQSMNEEVNNKGELVLFGSVVFHRDDIEKLRNLIDKNLPKLETDCFTIID